MNEHSFFGRLSTENPGIICKKAWRIFTQLQTMEDSPIKNDLLKIVLSLMGKAIQITEGMPINNEEKKSDLANLKDTTAAFIMKGSKDPQMHERARDLQKEAESLREEKSYSRVLMF